jgi:NADPH:quinone reductase-like Zn-dependent oxidoreductase
MQTVVYNQFGEPASVLGVREWPMPEPRPGQIRVRMLAAPVNPSDLMQIRGVYGMLPKLPATPGLEGVGVVESAGPGLLGKLLVGKRVCVPNSPTGSWAEFAIASAKQAIPVPASLPVEQAAMFFVNPATAYIMTRLVLRVPPNEWLLQTAAGSSLGKMVIRLGKRFGFKTINVVRRAEQADELRSLGADAAIVDDGGDLRTKLLGPLGHAHGVRFAIDPVGGATGSAVTRCLAPGGRLLLYGTLSGQPLSFSPRDLLTAGASIEGFWLANWMSHQKLIGKLRLVRSVSKLIQQGVLTSDVAHSFPLSNIREAVSAAEQPGRAGKVLLRIADAGKP